MDRFTDSALTIEGLLSNGGHCVAVVRLNRRSPALLRWMVRQALLFADDHGIPRWHPVLWLNILRMLWFLVCP